MRCDAAGEVLMEVARGGVLEASVRRDALGHAAACPGCARRLAGERALSVALRALAAETEAAAPPQLERALLQAFRLRHAGPVEAPAARRSWAWPWAAAAAAAAVAALVLPGRPVPRDRGPSTAPGRDVAAESEGFIALMYGEELDALDSAHVVRVELPTAAAGALGWAGLADRTSLVQADLIIGQDGIARAIRFLPGVGPSPAAGDRP